MKRLINLLMEGFSRPVGKRKTGKLSSRLLPLAHPCSQKRAIKSMTSSAPNISNSKATVPRRMASQRISPQGKTFPTLKIQEATNSMAKHLGL
jgi:hypothetical protein